MNNLTNNLLKFVAYILLSLYSTCCLLELEALDEEFLMISRLDGFSSETTFQINNWIIFEI